MQLFTAPQDEYLASTLRSVFMNRVYSVHPCIASNTGTSCSITLFATAFPQVRQPTSIYHRTLQAKALGTECPLSPSLFTSLCIPRTPTRHAPASTLARRPQSSVCAYPPDEAPPVPHRACSARAAGPCAAACPFALRLCCLLSACGVVDLQRARCGVRF